VCLLLPQVCLLLQQERADVVPRPPLLVLLLETALVLLVTPLLLQAGLQQVQQQLPQVAGPWSAQLQQLAARCAAAQPLCQQQSQSAS
jgi:hypothetical protein